MYKISIEEKYIANKDIDYRIYLSFILDSNSESDINYIEENNYFYNKEYIMKKLNISKSNLNNLIRKFLNYDLIDKELFNNSYIYKNNINKKYVHISENELYKLLEMSSNEIKVYLIIKNQLEGEIKKEITLSYIAESIGLSETNTARTIKKYINKLEKNELISYTYNYINKGENFKRYLFFINNNSEYEKKYNLLEAINLIDNGKKVTLYNHEYFYKNIKSYFYKRGNEYICCDIKTKKEKDLRLEDFKIYNSYITLNELLNLQFVIYE